MRILCNGFRWFAAAADHARSEHDVVELGRAELERLWAAPAEDGWRAVVPAGWEPDVALFCSPEYERIPPYLAELPCPVALWVGDWYANSQSIRQLADQADLILADAVGMRALRAGGIEHVEECCPWTFEPGLHEPAWEAQPEWDVGFLGNLSDAIHFDRLRWLARVAELPERHRVHAGGGLYGRDYVRFVQRTRISFNRSVTGDVNMRCFEAAACGSLVLIERGNVEVPRWFEPGREIVEYDESDFEDVVAHYLDNEDERLAVARAGWARVQEHAPLPRLRGLLARLEELAGEGVSRASTETTAAGRLATASQGVRVVKDPPWQGVELLHDGLEGELDGDARLQCDRGAFYAWYAANSGDREQVAAAAQWADEHLARAAALDPGDAVALMDRAELLVALDRMDAAREVAERLAAGLEDGEAVARPDRLRYPLGFTRFGLEWEAATARGEGGAERLGELALALAHRIAAAGHPDAPIRVDRYRRSLELAPLPATRLELARTLAGLGDHDGAVEELELLLAEQPLAPQIWRVYVSELATLGREDEARAFVERCVRWSKRLRFDEPGFEHELERLIAAAAAA